jgi:hypothetical protein
MGRLVAGFAYAQQPCSTGPSGILGCAMRDNLIDVQVSLTAASRRIARVYTTNPVQSEVTLQPGEVVTLTFHGQVFVTRRPRRMASSWSASMRLLTAACATNSEPWNVPGYR